MIGIIGAMSEEVNTLVENLENTSTVQKGPFTLHKGKLQTQDVMIAQCGISKVNAAALTQVMILEGITQLIFTGVAGGLDPKLKVGDIVISTDCLQHDADVSALGYALGQIPDETFAWRADEALRNLAVKSAKLIKDTNSKITVVEGRILSGDQFIANGEKAAFLHQTFHGACAEMEGAAVAQVCSKWAIPFVIIRSISDSANDDAKIDFREFTILAAQQAKQVVLRMLEEV